MLKLGERFDREFKKQNALCDWTQTAVGYHLYFNGKTSSILAKMHERFPGLPTEVSFPYGVELSGLKVDDTARSESMDDKPYANEVCERLGLGWLQWQTETPAKWRKNINLVVQDAKLRGYNWRKPTKPIKAVDSTATRVTPPAEQEPRHGQP